MEQRSLMMLKLLVTLASGPQPQPVFSEMMLLILLLLLLFLACKHSLCEAKAQQAVKHKGCQVVGAKHAARPARII